MICWTSKLHISFFCKQGKFIKMPANCRCVFLNKSCREWYFQTHAVKNLPRESLEAYTQDMKKSVHVHKNTPFELQK